MARFSLNQQIDELEREQRERRNVYARLVASGKLRQSVAEFQTERLAAAIRTLQWLEKHEQIIRERCPDLFPQGDR